MHAALTPSYGSPDIIELIDADEPEAGEHDLIVQVHDSVVTAGDRRLRSADFPGISAVFGRLLLGVTRPRHAVQGTMFSGEVVAVGAEVQRFAVGDRVFGSVDAGAYAERVVVADTGSVARLPDHVDHEQGASISYGGGTALHFLRDLADLQPDERVLILGASGGVGRFAVQLTKHMGAEVTAVCSESAFELVRELGADHVMDHRTTDFTATAERYDVIFDIADASSFSHARSSLSPTGRYMTLYISISVFIAMAWTALIGGPKALFAVVMPGQARTEELRGLLDEGVLRAVVAERFPLSRLVDAHALGDAGAHGEIIVSVTPAAASI